MNDIKKDYETLLTKIGEFRDEIYAAIIAEASRIDFEKISEEGDGTVIQIEVTDCVNDGNPMVGFGGGPNEKEPAIYDIFADDDINEVVGVKPTADGKNFEITIMDAESEQYTITGDKLTVDGLYNLYASLHDAEEEWGFDNEE